MKLVRFKPIRNVTDLNYRMDQLVNHLFDDFFKGDRSNRVREWNPKVDIVEEAEQFVMTAELPGVEKDNIAIDVNGRILTVKGERSSDNTVNDEHFHRRERFFGSFKRSFSLPTETDSEKIKAVYKDGVLKLNIPKPESSRPKQITVQ